MSARLQHLNTIEQKPQTLNINPKPQKTNQNYKTHIKHITPSPITHHPSPITHHPSPITHHPSHSNLAF